MTHHIFSLNAEKDYAIKIAKELCYDEKYIRQIKNASTCHEIDNILKTARNAK